MQIETISYFALIFHYRLIISPGQDWKPKQKKSFNLVFLQMTADLVSKAFQKAFFSRTHLRKFVEVVVKQASFCLFCCAIHQKKRSERKNLNGTETSVGQKWRSNKSYRVY